MKILNLLKSKALTRLGVRENVHHGHNFHVGPGSVLWAPSRLDIGYNVYVGKNVTIQVDGSIGDEVLFANGSGVVGRLDHNYLQVGTPVRSAQWVGNTPSLSSPTTIGSDVWVGFNATIYSGLQIGNSSIIAAGSVVTKNVPENSIVAGCPAKFIRHRYSPDQFEKHWKQLEEKNVRRIKLTEELTFGVENS